MIRPDGLALDGLQPPRAILFDWDNTLVDTWSVIHAALEPTFEAMGMTPWTLEECRQRVRGSARDEFPKLFGERTAEATRLFYERFEATHLELLRALPGAEELLAGLAAQGLYLGIVSNKRGVTLRKEAAHIGWDRHFRKLVGATDAPRDKPAPDPVYLALGMDGPPPLGEVWFVGDTDVDMLCAVRAGCVPVLLREEAPGPGEFLDCRPRLHLGNCLALGELLVGEAKPSLKSA
ncbi:MAG TPA: HAD hydrolase-like protein [Kiloniellales bacterium]|nr:HAD hydrolase-like protein [Kiloniellales bacterium]